MPRYDSDATKEGEPSPGEEKRNGYAGGLGAI